MAERPTFGEPVPKRNARSQATPAAEMFSAGEELPLFSGCPIPATEKPFAPTDQSLKQTMLPDMPPLDYDHILANDKALRRGKKGTPLSPNATLFSLAGEPAPDNRRLCQPRQTKQPHSHCMRQLPHTLIF